MMKSSIHRMSGSEASEEGGVECQEIKIGISLPNIFWFNILEFNYFLPPTFHQQLKIFYFTLLLYIFTKYKLNLLHPIVSKISFVCYL